MSQEIIFLFILCIIISLGILALRVLLRTAGKETIRHRDTYAGYLPTQYDSNSIAWCAHFLDTSPAQLESILRNIPKQYSEFRIRKRSGGYRMISVPSRDLMHIQKIIYQRILLPVPLHPAATGFRKRISITDNARVHLGKKEIFKTDIRHFFYSIRQPKVVNAFEKIGYPKEIARILATLCCLRKRLPQGAPTSPALSNILAYDMDRRLYLLSCSHRLTYTRYADDLTFSGEYIDQKQLFLAVRKMVAEEDFTLKTTKTRFLNEKRRKIVTGISISSGHILTIPKAKKREMRQRVHYILTRGLVAHQDHIGSKDPAYLKRTLGYFHFWLQVEPENTYVIRSIQALKKLERQS